MKKNIYITRILLVCTLFLFLGNISILKADETANYSGLFIAIDNYKSKVWSPLKNPVNDANAVKSVLKTKYGFSSVSTLFNQEATRAKILETIEKKVNQLSENDNFVIYFSGHGIKLGDEGYWVPVEAKSQERYELLSTTEIKNVISKSKCKHILIMVDACFSSTIFKSSNLSYSNDGSDTYYDQVSKLISRQAITAGGLEPVADGRGEHSVFVKYILKFLNNNQKPLMDAGELYELIKYPVAANSPNTPQFGHLQNTGHEGGQFLFKLSTTTTTSSSLSSPSVSKEGSKLCDSPVYFEEGEVVKFGQDGGTLHARTDFKNVKYEWSYNSEIIDHNGPNLPIKKSGMYGVTIIMEDGDCSNSAIAEVSIVLPKIVIDILEGNEVEFTHKGMLNAAITGYSDNIVYEWKKGNFIISDKSSIEVTESNTYTVIIKLPDGRELGRKTTKVTIKNRIYTVALGDNIERIARKFYGSPDKAYVIYEANPYIKSGDVLKVGSTVIVPNIQQEDGEIPLLIAAYKSFAPLTHPDLQNGGMISDIVTSVYAKMNQKVDHSFIPNNQMRGITFNGRVEVSYPFTKNKNDLMLFQYSDPIYSTLTVFFANTSSPVEDMEKTMQKRMKKGKYRKLIVAIPVGFTSDKLLQYYSDKYILLKPMKTLEDCFIAMKNGQVDLVSAPQMVGLVTIKNEETLDRSDFKILDKAIENTTLHIVVSKEHPKAGEIINNFNKALAKAREDGTVGKIIDTHIDLIQKNTKP
ncbi:MAG: caspase family protein [Saprospiraceae bacterium]